MVPRLFVYVLTSISRPVGRQPICASDPSSRRPPRRLVHPMARSPRNRRGPPKAGSRSSPFTGPAARVAQSAPFMVRECALPVSQPATSYGI